MKITNQWLKKESACDEGCQYFLSKHADSIEAAELLKMLIADRQFLWAIWLLQKILPRIDLVRLAVFSAEQVIEIFEKKYPDDDRPRKAIEAAKKYIKNPTADAAYAAHAARAAAHAARAADAARAAYAAAHAAYAAARDARAAADAAYAAHAARAAAHDARDARAAARAMYVKIIKFGIKLLKKTEVKK